LAIDDVEAKAITQANGVVTEAMREHESLGEKVLEAVFSEGSVRQTVQGFLRAARAVAGHPKMPDEVKAKVETFRQSLLSTWAGIIADDDGDPVSGGTPEAAVASEAKQTASRSIAEAVAMKDADGFTAEDFAYVPSAFKPGTWKLRLTKTPGGDPDSAIVGAAAAALGPGGFRGQKVDILAEDLPGVKAKVRAAWKKANPDKESSEMPEGISESSSDTREVLFTETACIVPLPSEAS
jgi:hypothetical protein